MKWNVRMFCQGNITLASVYHLDGRVSMASILWHMELRRRLSQEDIDDAVMILIYADTCHRPGLKKKCCI